MSRSMGRLRLIDICRVECREHLIIQLLKEVCFYNKDLLNRETDLIKCNVFLFYDFSSCVFLHKTEMATEVLYPLRARLTSLRSGRNGE